MIRLSAWDVLLSAETSCTQFLSAECRVKWAGHQPSNEIGEAIKVSGPTQEDPSQDEENPKPTQSTDSKPVREQFEELDRFALIEIAGVLAKLSVREISRSEQCVSH